MFEKRPIWDLCLYNPSTIHVKETNVCEKRKGLAYLVKSPIFWEKTPEEKGATYLTKSPIFWEKSSMGLCFYMIWGGYGQ